MKVLLLSLVLFGSSVFAKQGDITCHFKYDSKGNPEEFPRTFSPGAKEDLLIGMMTLRVSTALPTDGNLAKKFTLLNFGIWDDAGAANINQAEFYAKDILVGSDKDVEFELKVSNPAVPPDKEVYTAKCRR